MRKVISILILFILPYAYIFSQEISTPDKSNNSTKFNKLLIKTNLLADILTVANLGAEINLNDQFSVDLPIYYSPYNISSEKKIRVFVIQPEIKYWFQRNPFSGHYVGANISTGWFNVALSKKKRYQDNKMIMGVGITYGYYYHILDSKFILGANAGIGYNRFSYDKFRNEGAKEKLGTGVKNYFGITQLGITLAYKIDLK